jgi:hypothetical protein
MARGKICYFEMGAQVGTWRAALQSTAYGGRSWRTTALHRIKRKIRAEPGAVCG